MTADGAPTHKVISPRRREALLDRLVQIFLAHGFATFTLDDLALRCHCSTDTLRALASEPEHLQRLVIGHFLSGAGIVVEARVAAIVDPRRRPGEYLSGVAEALAPAANAFFRDLERFPAGRRLYEAGTCRAAARVGDLLRDAVRAGRLRDVQASFLAETVSVMTSRIGAGAVLVTTGLDDARAYAELALLVAAGASAS